MQTVNAYLFTTPEVVLVDCGEKSAGSWQALQGGLAQHGLGIQDLQRVVITHAHVDHIGMAAEIARVSGAQIWVSDLALPWAVELESMWQSRATLMYQMLEEALGERPEGLRIRQQLTRVGDEVLKMWDPIPPQQVHCFSTTDVLELGGQQWEVIYAPGHSNTQTCFFEPESGRLLAADMLLRITPTPVIEFSRENPRQRSRGLVSMLDSYQKLLQREISLVYPGHFEPFDQPHALIQEQLSRIHRRKAQCLDLIRQGQGDF
ncbi:MAG: MBL fold metallo-hydrolase, partial [Bacteroidetes bacterium]